MTFEKELDLLSLLALSNSIYTRMRSFGRVSNEVGSPTCLRPRLLAPQPAREK
jgi:hypothetical protein